MSITEFFRITFRPDISSSQHQSDLAQGQVRNGLSIHIICLAFPQNVVVYITERDSTHVCYFSCFRCFSKYINTNLLYHQKLFSISCRPFPFCIWLRTKSKDVHIRLLALVEFAHLDITHQNRGSCPIQLVEARRSCRNTIFHFHASASKPMTPTLEEESRFEIPHSVFLVYFGSVSPRKTPLKFLFSFFHCIFKLKITQRFAW